MGTGGLRLGLRLWRGYESVGFICFYVWYVILLSVCLCGNTYFGLGYIYNIYYIILKTYKQVIFGLSRLRAGRFFVEINLRNDALCGEMCCIFEGLSII